MSPTKTSTGFSLADDLGLVARPEKPLLRRSGSLLSRQATHPAAITVAIVPNSPASAPGTFQPHGVFPRDGSGRGAGTCTSATGTGTDTRTDVHTGVGTISRTDTRTDTHIDTGMDTSTCDMGKVTHVQT